MMNSTIPQPSEAYTKYMDPELEKILRPHQLHALQFLIPRLLGVELTGDTPDPSGIPLTGAILADDMGTGKTLTALAVLWCLCRHGKGKGIVVCPSSLVNNWKAEVKKWFPKTLDRSGLFINGSNRSSGPKGTDQVIELFATSHPSMRPLLVLSYDMFRLYADILNDITSFSTVICDEGHRLKNAIGNKTTLALGNCCAMQRLVLTGTPIQNNLDELYAVVQFAAPGYLGDLKEYQSTYSDHISKRGGPSERSRRATDMLRDKLSKILLRRNRNAILRATLPPRVVTCVICRMSGSQSASYLAECHNILNFVKESEGHIVIHDDLDNCDVTPDLSGKRARVGESAASTKTRESKSEGTMVLSKLLSLRQICSVPTSADGVIPDFETLLEQTVKLRVRRE